MGKKADAGDFVGRFREIISDPLNLLIRRDPRAGFVEGGHVFLHNGLTVPISGPNAYYGEFSSILAMNRGVHEPLEEFIFQELLEILPSSPFMLELGAYWGHYSMWLKSKRPAATVHLVEPDAGNLNAGKLNFEANGFSGEFICEFVGKNSFSVDQYISKNGIEKVDVLHSDIQGYELEMLEDCSTSLSKNIIDYIFVSTHSQQLHEGALKLLEGFNYRIEVSSDFDSHTTSYDGFIFASSPSRSRIFSEFAPMGRMQIEAASPKVFIEYLLNIR